MTYYIASSPLDHSRKTAESGHEKRNLSLGLLIRRPIEILSVAALGKPQSALWVCVREEHISGYWMGRLETVVQLTAQSVSVAPTCWVKGDDGTSCSRWLSCTVNLQIMNDHSQLSRETLSERKAWTGWPAISADTDFKENIWWSLLGKVEVIQKAAEISWKPKPNISQILQKRVAGRMEHKGLIPPTSFTLATSRIRLP